jgi:hypothetical protein
MNKITDILSEKQFTNVDMIFVPQFVDKNLLSSDAITHPDYRLKILQAYYGGTHTITCSKCHHCR